jgi:signal transduction histidine kinase
MEDHAGKLKSINAKLVQEIQEREHAQRELNRSQADLRNLSAHQEHLREEERAMIAREIHDELGQVLSTLKMDLGTLENHFPKDKKVLFEITQSMSELIYLTIQRVKRISQELRPSVLDHLTFPQAVSWQIDEFMKTTGISCQLAIRNAEDLQLTPDAANALFRVLQEALTNIIRHAEAKQVSVSMEKTGAHVVLKIQDNGKGIANKEMADPQSFGLIGMRERIHHLNGHIEIKSGASSGTAIVCTIPLKQNHGKTI